MADDVQRRALHDYYERGLEADRLSADPAGRLEFERTKEIVLRHLPAAPATIADIGGGPGRYSLWLAELGYRVLHRDVVPLHIDQVRHAAGIAPGIATSAIGAAAIDTAVADARQLDLAGSSVDAVLLLGPLYHLERRSDRVQALREAGRIVRPGGPVFAAAISRWAARLDGVLQKRIYAEVPEFLEFVGPLERTGLMPPLLPGWFCGFAHRPSQLRGEFRSAGLTVADLVCVEGAAVLLDDLGVRMAAQRDWQVVLETARALERVPELMGIGPHLLATGFSG
jgi:SAM-dependent methyltransferase